METRNSSWVLHHQVYTPSTTSILYYTMLFDAIRCYPALSYLILSYLTKLYTFLVSFTSSFIDQLI